MAFLTFVLLSADFDFFNLSSADQLLLFAHFLEQNFPDLEWSTEHLGQVFILLFIRTCIKPLIVVTKAPGSWACDQRNPGPSQKTVMDIGASTQPGPVAHLGVSCAVVVQVPVPTGFGLSTRVFAEVYPSVTCCSPVSAYTYNAWNWVCVDMFWRTPRDSNPWPHV